MLKKDRPSSLATRLEVLRENASAIGAAAVAIVTAITAASLYSWRGIVELLSRGASGDPVAALAPVAIAVFVLAVANTAYLLSVGVNSRKSLTEILRQADASDEQLRQAREVAAAHSVEVRRLGAIAERYARELTESNRFSSRADTRELWSGFGGALIADAGRYDAEVDLRLSDNSRYDATVHQDRLVGYCLDRLLRGGGLVTWTVTFYIPAQAEFAHRRVSMEPAVRFVALVRAAERIATQRGLKLDLNKIRVVVINGHKPDLATFIASRPGTSGSSEQVLLEYARPLDVNRMRQTQNRVTLARCPRYIHDRHSEIEGRIANAKLMSIWELEDTVGSLISKTVIFDPDNLPGVANGDSLTFDDSQDVLNEAVELSRYIESTGSFGKAKRIA